MGCSPCRLSADELIVFYAKAVLKQFLAVRLDIGGKLQRVIARKPLG
jgi:hypothetical protein